MKIIQVRSKDINKELELYDYDISKKDQVELLETEEHKVIFVNKEPAFFYHEGKLVPTLKLLQKQMILKKVAVDMGAVKFIVSGADVMRPGITEIEEGIKENDFIVIIDQIHKKPLAIGIALHDSEEMQKLTNGKVIKNIHYVGDEIWKTER